MMHPDSDVKYLGDSRKTGVIATRDIAEGTLVWFPGETDQVLSLQQVCQLSEIDREHLAEYAYLTNEGTYIVSEDMARFVNHSCDANSLSVAGLEISIAVRDIGKGEEITEDYGLYYANGGFANCNCASSNCRHDITKGDVWIYGDDWDLKISTSFNLIATVEQPLWRHMGASLRARIEAILASKLALPSCKTLGCSREYLEKAAELLWPSTDRS